MFRISNEKRLVNGVEGGWYDLAIVGVEDEDLLTHSAKRMQQSLLNMGRRINLDIRRSEEQVNVLTYFKNVLTYFKSGKLSSTLRRDPRGEESTKTGLARRLLHGSLRLICTRWTALLPERLVDHITEVFEEAAYSHRLTLFVLRSPLHEGTLGARNGREALVVYVSAQQHRKLTRTISSL